MNIIEIISVYLGFGICAIALLDLFTKRVRNRLKTASLDTQLLTGESHKMAFVVTILALWLLWPVAIYAAIRK